MLTGNCFGMTFAAIQVVNQVVVALVETMAIVVAAVHVLAVVDMVAVVGVVSVAQTSRNLLTLLESLLLLPGMRRTAE